MRRSSRSIGSQPRVSRGEQTLLDERTRAARGREDSREKENPSGTRKLEEIPLTEGPSKSAVQVDRRRKEKTKQNKTKTATSVQKKGDTESAEWTRDTGIPIGRVELYEI